MALRPLGASGSQAEFGWVDVAILAGVAGLTYAAIRLGFGAPEAVSGPEIQLAVRALPYYTLLSVVRMVAAYAISLVFALTYGYVAAHSRSAEGVLMPLLDVLQSVPILSFLPVALLSLSVLLPERAAVGLASIVLIVTSMAWNMAFSVFQSFSTLPRDLVEASTSFRLHPWLRLKVVELPFAARPLIWNSMLSWAGGWFFLMAAETFSLGQRDFRLPGLGSYLQTAAQAGDVRAVGAGLLALVLTIVALDQLLWRPALAWSERFRVESTGGEEASHSWLFDLYTRSWLAEQLSLHVWGPLNERIDHTLMRIPAARARPKAHSTPRRAVRIGLLVVLGAAIAYALVGAIRFLAQLPGATWLLILASVGATMGRVFLALVLGALWTVPAGVAIGSQARVASVAQPIVQVVASIPATALFPIIVVLLVSSAGGLNIAAVLLMLLGTQWYILFNVIAGAANIPRDLYDTAAMLRMSTGQRWRALILPALYPYLVTGLVTASGGAWNASIVAEYTVVAGTTYRVLGVGALIAGATATGRYALLLASTLTMIAAVVAINRLLWRRLFVLASERFRVE